MILDSKPYLTAAMLQAFFYAIYLGSSVHALRWLMYDEAGWKLKGRDKVNWPLLVITLTILLFSTTDVVLQVLIQLRSNSISDIKSETLNQLSIASTVAENTTLLIADAFLIFRCWLVYQRSWGVIYFLLLLWLANTSFLTLWLVAYTMSTTEHSTVTLHDKMALFSLRLFYCVTFTMNLYATSAIIYRLRRHGNRFSSILYHICRIIATTGILYTITSLPLVVIAFFLPQYTPQYLICDVVNFSTAGITFNLLLVRVGRLRAEVEVDADGSSRGRDTSTRFSTQLSVPTLATYGLFMQSDIEHQGSLTTSQ